MSVAMGSELRIQWLTLVSAGWSRLLASHSFNSLLSVVRGPGRSAVGITLREREGEAKGKKRRVMSGQAEFLRPRFNRSRAPGGVSIAQWLPTHACPRS